ncbi:hypothetical protein EQ249_15300 [Citrobacter freundii]|nr:hypothetical protein EQ249_15300 [Citrobacter freundii]
MSAMFSMIVLRMKACPQHSTGKEGVTISLSILFRTSAISLHRTRSGGFFGEMKYLALMTKAITERGQTA